MKKFIQGFFTLVASLVFFTIIIIIGLAYSFFYSLWLTVSLKNWRAFPLFWWSRFTGLLSAIGSIFMALAKGWDIVANVLAGEMLEDLTTHKEATTFGAPITVSASIGEIESRPGKPLIKNGKRITKMLNVVFNQKQHATDSWEILLKREELNNEFFKPRKK